jgi:hypothetical protein
MNNSYIWQLLLFHDSHELFMQQSPTCAVHGCSSAAALLATGRACWHWASQRRCQASLNWHQSKHSTRSARRHMQQQQQSQRHLADRYATPTAVAAVLPIAAHLRSSTYSCLQAACLCSGAATVLTYACKHARRVQLLINRYGCCRPVCKMMLPE